VSILAYTRQRLSPYKRIRRLEFSELPKTISGKIRRVELRTQETDRLGPPGTATPGTAPPGSTPGAAAAGTAPPGAQPGAAAAGFTPGAAAGPRGTREFWEEDFPELKS